MKYLFLPIKNGNCLEVDDPVPMWPRGHFYGLKKKSGNKYLNDFYMIWKFNAEYNLKNFNLIPLYRNGRLYINYNEFAFYEMLSKYTLNVDEMIETNRPHNQTPLEYIRFELEHYLRKQAVYTQLRVVRLKFDAYIKKQNTCFNNQQNIIKHEIGDVVTSQ